MPASPISPVALRAALAEIQSIHADAWEVGYLKGLISTVVFLEAHPMVQSVQVTSERGASVMQWGSAVRWFMDNASAPPLFQSELAALVQQVVSDCKTPPVIGTLFSQPISLANLEEVLGDVFEADWLAHVRRLSLEHTLPSMNDSIAPLEAEWSPTVLRQVAAQMEQEPHHPGATYVDHEPGYLKGLADVLEFLEKHPDIVTVHLASPSLTSGVVVVPASPHPQPFEDDLRVLEARLATYGQAAGTFLYSGQSNREAWVDSARHHLGPVTVGKLRAAHLEPTWEPKPAATRPRM